MTESDDDRRRRLMRKILREHEVFYNRNDPIARILGPSAGAKAMPADGTPKDLVVICKEISFGELPMFPDNVIAACDWQCGRTVEFRPDAPAGQRVCITCASERGSHDN